MGVVGEVELSGFFTEGEEFEVVFQFQIVGGN